jgi:hypothetical protein
MRVQSKRSLLLLLVFQHAYLHEGEGQFVPCLFLSIKHRVFFSFHGIQERLSHWVKPSTASLLFGTFADMTRGKSELRAENALLRHQLIILRRQITRPTYRKRDRLLLVLLARMVRTWKQTLFLVQEDDTSAASIVSSSACSGSVNRRRIRESQGSRSKRLP